MISVNFLINSLYSLSHSSIVSCNLSISSYIPLLKNDFSVFLNGSKIDSDTSGTTPIGLNKLDFKGGDTLYPFYGNVKQVAVFNEALSDSELATLTTL